MNGTDPVLCGAAPPADVATAKARSQNCALGADAKFFVSASTYRKVVIEVVATSGATPRQSALDHLVGLFGDVTDKPGGATVVMGPDAPAFGHAPTLAEIRALEDRVRTRFADGDTAVFFFLVTSDPYVEDTQDAKVLGLAHRPSSMVVFQKTIDGISGGLGQPSRDIVEKTVVAHELGHVLGLVNLGTAMRQMHEDAAHAGHDSNASCLMYFANNSSKVVANLLQGGVVPDFDAACSADLGALR